MRSWFVPRYHHLFAREDFPLRSDPELRVRCAGNLLTASEILAQPGAETLSVHQPAVQAGDLIVWNNLLPHGSGRNTSDAPRIGNNIGLTPLTVHENLFRTRVRGIISDIRWLSNTESVSVDGRDRGAAGRAQVGVPADGGRGRGGARVAGGALARPEWRQRHVRRALPQADPAGARAADAARREAARAGAVVKGLPRGGRCSLCKPQ